MAVNQEVYTLETAQSETVKSTDRILDFDLSAELNHGVVVSNLAYAVAVEMGLDEEFCYQMAIAGMLSNGMEQYLVFENPQNSATIEVLDLYVYHSGIKSGLIPLSTVVGVFKSLIGVLLLFGANGISKGVRGESII